MRRSTWPALLCGLALTYTEASPARSSLLRVGIRGTGALPRAGAPPSFVGSLTARPSNRFMPRSGKSSRYKCFVRFRTEFPRADPSGDVCVASDVCVGRRRLSRPLFHNRLKDRVLEVALQRRR
jgi:hypothetical protein